MNTCSRHIKQMAFSEQKNINRISVKPHLDAVSLLKPFSATLQTTISAAFMIGSDIYGTCILTGNKNFDQLYVDA